MNKKATGGISRNEKINFHKIPFVLDGNANSLPKKAKTKVVLNCTSQKIIKKHTRQIV